MVLTTPHPAGNYILNLGAKLGIFARDKHQHKELLNRQKIDQIVNASNLNLSRYQRFLFGFNQLAILEKKSDFDLQSPSQCLHGRFKRRLPTDARKFPFF